MNDKPLSGEYAIGDKIHVFHENHMRVGEVVDISIMQTIHTNVKELMYRVKFAGNQLMYVKADDIYDNKSIEDMVDIMAGM